MIFNRKKWRDVDWCDRNVKPILLSDDDIIKAARKVNPYSTAVITLFAEACRRRLAAIVPMARQQLDSVEPSIATSAAEVLQEMGDASDVSLLLDVVEDAIDRYHLAAILEAIVTLDPARSEYALEAAGRWRCDRFSVGNYVLASVIARVSEVVRDDWPNLEDRLLDWASNSSLSPGDLEPVYRRLSALPRTERIEDFFVEFCVRDDGAQPNLKNIVHEALRDPN